MATTTDEDDGAGALAKTRPRHRRIDLDWEVVRRDYERFGASIRDICIRYKLKSRTTVDRVIVKQGWKRDLSAIADRIATNTAAFHEALQPGAKHRGDRQSRAPVIIGTAAPLGVADLPEPRPKWKGRKSRAKAAVRARAAEQAEKAADAEHARNRPPIPNLQSQNANTRLTCLNLAQRQAIVRSQELDNGDRMISLGCSILTNLQVLFDSEASEDEKTAAKLRLKQFNPSKETFSGLAKLCPVLLDGGTLMKRRALAMDAKGMDAEDSGTQPNVEAARLILSGMSAPTLLELRQKAYEISKLPKEPAISRP